MNKVLVTGGAGYIGSHTTIELIKKGYEVIIVDNFSNSEPSSLDRIKKITRKDVPFIFGDLKDRNVISKIFESFNDIDTVIHFAAFKAVGESVAEPLKYYNNNILSLINLLYSMKQYNVPNLIFSSSCTVYGQPDELPVTEDTPLKPASSPYGNTKKISEDIITDFINSGNYIKSIILRYFNPVGADISGDNGELPQGIPNNLLPYITQTALGIRECLNVYGNDYDTHDGTAIRDYIHVSDLANAHIDSMRYLSNKSAPFCDIFNIGTGEGYSVLDVINSINKFLDRPLPYKIVNRRPGDVEKIWADNTKAKNTLNWFPKFNLDDMTSSSLNWEKKFRGTL